MAGTACCAASAMICSRRLAKNESAATKSAPMRFWVIVVKATSMSLDVVAFSTTSCSPRLRADSCNSAGWRAVSALFGLRSTATLEALGTKSCSSASRFGPSSALNQLTPVTLPPGRLRLATRPYLRGSSLLVILRVPLDRRCCRILAFHPLARAAGPVRRDLALRHDALAAEQAGMLEHERPSCSNTSLSTSPHRGFRM